MVAALTGVCPIPAVPFTSAEDVDIDSFIAGVADIHNAGAGAVMFPGFASEFHKLHADEVKLLRTELLRYAADAGLAVIHAVQDHATRLAVRTAREAMDAGAVGINLLPPYFLGPAPGQVIDHVGAVCTALDGAELTMQYAPGFTGSTLTPTDIIEIAARHPNLTAVKVEVASPGPVLRQFAAAGLATTVGAAGLHMVEAFEAGAIGVQPGSGFVRLYVHIWDLLVAGNIAAAREAHRSLLPAIGRWMDSVEHILAADKAVLMRRGIFVDGRVRRPGRDLDSEDIALIE